MAAEKAVAKGTQTAQEPIKAEPVYKVTHGQFTAKIEAVTAAAEARKKGFYVRLVVEKGNYKLLYAEGIGKAAAAAAVEIIKVAGLNAEIN